MIYLQKVNLKMRIFDNDNGELQSKRKFNVLSQNENVQQFTCEYPDSIFSVNIDNLSFSILNAIARARANN